MDIKFDSAAAEELIIQMDSYCNGIVKETRELLKILKDADSWDDKQKMAFANNINEMSGDLNSALRLESEYLKTFQQRVIELRG